MNVLLIASLTIIGAAYGRQNVTDQVRSFVQGEVLQVPANNETFGDTWPGAQKSLVVVYSLDGQPPQVAIATEGELMTVAPVPPPVVYEAPPPEYVPPEPVVYEPAPPPPSPVGFWGHHPVPGGGWCLLDGPHLHDYEPDFYDQYALRDGYFWYGWGFHEWMYTHPHPIPGGGWCMIDGPHRHPYRPDVGFMYDPVNHGYYYDRERAHVVRTEIVRPPPHYHPPAVVVEHQRHPPERVIVHDARMENREVEHREVEHHVESRPPPRVQEQPHNAHIARPIPAMAHPKPAAHAPPPPAKKKKPGQH